MARRRRGPVVGLVVLLVVAALLVVGLSLGDGYAEERAEREVSSRLQSELELPAPPAVDIEGRPFLTQVVGRHLRRVHVVADDLPASRRNQVPVAHADVVLEDVTTDDWFATATAAHATGTARIDYAALGDVAGLPLTYAGGGRVEAETSTSVLGVDLAARVSGTPALDVAAQTVSLVDTEVRVAGVQLPGGTADALVSAVTRPIPVTAPLVGLRLTALTPQDDGLHVSLEGSDVRVER